VSEGRPTIIREKKLNMKARTILVPVFFLVLGGGIGIVAGILYATHTTATVMLALKQEELRRSYDAALNACKTQSPETAVWASDQLLMLIQDFRKIGYSNRTLTTQEIIAHARLAKLWEVNGQIDKKDEQVHLALELAKSSNSPGLEEITSEKLLFVFLENAEKRSL
jgi:hypothetical protein